jgi:hypothetical protein
MRILIMQACCSLVLLMMPWSLGAQANGSHDVSVSPREFVEGFYKWYAPRALRDNATAAWNIALKFRSSDIGPQLAQLLKEDSTAQARCQELVGLDFDPFLNTQDPAERYEVGKITQKGKHFQAEIYSVQSGERSSKPALNAELSSDSGHWIFVNFHYPDGSDLLTILKSPRPACSVPRVPNNK